MVCFRGSREVFLLFSKQVKQELQPGQKPAEEDAKQDHRADHPGREWGHIPLPSKPGKEKSQQEDHGWDDQTSEKQMEGKGANGHFLPPAL
jgi:hypothetical protein